MFGLWRILTGGSVELQSRYRITQRPPQQFLLLVDRRKSAAGAGSRELRGGPTVQGTLHPIVFWLERV